MNGSESWTMKIELTCAHSINTMTIKTILRITMKPVFVLTKPSLMALIFIS